MQLKTLAITLLIGVPSLSQGALTFHIIEAGDDVRILGFGSLDTSSFLEIQTPIEPTFSGGGTEPGFAVITVGVTPADLLDVDQFNEGIQGSSDFGSGSLVFADFGEGSPIGFSFDMRAVILPEDYVSGSFISGSATYLNTSIAEMGVSEGAHVWTLPSDQTITILTVPEPASASLFSLALTGLLFTRRRSR
ncbi:MAG: PEP-CTERM sorting domain-containing protein [Verrucomicrobiota bacterium JB023]|nr:PEP-CTERM sorting domain-containing protein [Verrucomicrobiota bacterium JB023]